MALAVERALVLAHPAPGAAPTDSLAGVPLALRTVLTLQKEGATRIVLAGRAEERETLDAMVRDRRVRVPVEVREAATRAQAVAEMGAEDTPFLLASHDDVVDPRIYRALAAAPRKGAIGLAAMQGGARVGPCVLEAGALDAIAETGELEATLDAMLADGRLEGVEVAGWTARATSPEGRRRAVRELFEACRKPVDGIVARHLNRHVSIFVSKRIVALPVTPNFVSAITFLIGVLAAVLASRGGYVPMLAGALCFQLNSILDGVDGELARVRFQFSKLGEWLDTVSDDLSNVLFYIGVGLGTAHMGGHATIAWMGWAAAAGGIGTSAMYYAELVRLGSGDFYALSWSEAPKGAAGAVYTVIRYVTKKDFFILLFVAMAALGVLPWALPIMLAGTTVTFVSATVRTARWAFGKR